MTSSALHLQHHPPLVALLDREFSSDRMSERAAGLVGIVDQEHLATALYGPLRGFLSRPGKEFRSRLVELCWKLAGGKSPVCEHLGNVVEVLHAGSLIVDDIEDESVSRRGQPALHVSHGLPVALNAGNWMYFWAYSLLENLDVGPHVKLGLYRWLGRTMARCHEGQALDLTVTMSRLSQNDVPALVEMTTRLKAGALMGLAAVMPAVAAGLNQEAVCSFQRFGESLGVGLQMLDDLGGLTSERRCHKGHEDLIHGRPTWPWAWLAETLSEVEYRHLQRRARSVETRDLHPEPLAKELREVLAANGKTRIWEHLVRTMKLLPHEILGAHGVDELQQEFERLMSSYE